MSYPNNPPVPASITVDTTASINSGLVGFWPLTDGSGGVAVDLSTGGNDGTLSVSNLWSSQEKGVLFDGSTREYVSGTGVHLGSSSGTLSLWFKADAEVNGPYLLSLPYVSASSNGFDIRAITGGCRVDLATSSGFKTLSYTTQNVQDGSIYHIAATYNGSDIVLYVNGNQVATTTHTGTIDQQANGEFTINNFSPLRNDKADGYYQNVRVYDRALTATEVAELYSVPWTGTDYVAQNLTPDTPIAMGVDPNHSLSSGLVGYWPLSDGSGTTARDISGGGNDGTQSGGVSWASTEKGTAASFDGVDDRFLPGSGLSRNLTAMTISAWVNPDVVSGSRFVYYESNNTGNNFTRLALAVYNGDVQIAGRDDDGDSYTVFASSSGGIVSTGVWQHLVAVFDPTGNGSKVYLDGADVTNTSDNTGDGFPDTDPLYYSIGSHSGNSNTFDGNIQNVRVYNRALSATEVEDLYNEPWAGVVTAKSAPPQYLTVDTADSINNNLVAFWPLSDDGTTATELVNGVNGTGSGGYSFGPTSKGVAAEFDGTNGKFDLGAGTDWSRNKTAMTCSAWIAADNAASNSGFIFYETNSLNVLQTRFGMRLYSGKLQCVGRDDDADGFTIFAESTNTQIIYNDIWYHVVAVFDPTGAGCKVYVDGDDVTTASDNTGDGFPDTASLVAAIGSSNTTNFYDGHIQNMRLYDRALSASEVSRLYQDPWAGTDRAIEPSPTVKDLDTSSTLTTNLVGWWPLTEFGPQDTLAYDISGSGNHGVANGGVQRQFTDTVRAASFDGVDDYFEVSDTDDLSFTSGGSDSPFSVSAWVYLNSLSAQSFIGKYENTSPWTGEWNLGNNPTGNFFLQCVDGSPTIRVRRDTVDSLPLNRWVLVTAVYDGTATDSGIELYVNGAAASSTAFGQDGSYISMDNTTAPLTIGTALTGYADPYETDGLIQNVRVYSRALSAAEVQTLYDDPWVGLATDSLVYAYYSAAFLQRLG